MSSRSFSISYKLFSIYFHFFLAYVKSLAYICKTIENNNKDKQNERNENKIHL